MWSQKEIYEFSDLIWTLSHYRECCLARLGELSESDVRSPDELHQLKQAVNCNANLFEYLAYKAPTIFGHTPPGQIVQTRSTNEIDTSDLHQLMLALKSAARDWTAIGDAERLQTYEPVNETLREFLPRGSKILVPGAGLCRLAVEIASSDYVAYANENAFIMLVMSHIAFRHKREFRIFPFLHQISGLENFNDALISDVFPKYDVRDESHPDAVVDPNLLLEQQRLVLMAGDIDGLKSTMSYFDGVVTCFFIDVVSDVYQLIQLIYQILKPGGFWINLGPLMMHRADDDFFAKASFNDINKMAQKIGFNVIKESRIDTTYVENPRNNIKTTYRCQLLVSQK